MHFNITCPDAFMKLVFSDFLWALCEGRLQFVAKDWLSNPFFSPTKSQLATTSRALLQIKVWLYLS